MKKKLLTMLALLANVVLAAVAQDTPAITFEAPAVERTITIGLNRRYCEGRLGYWYSC